jgi:hypothetical protein
MFVFFWVVPIALCGWLAARKGRNVFGWVVFGFFFTIIALFLLALLPAVDAGERAS